MQCMVILAHTIQPVYTIFGTLKELIKTNHLENESGCTLIRHLILAFLQVRSMVLSKLPNDAAHNMKIRSH
jgi:hypothetical protein